MSEVDVHGEVLRSFVDVKELRHLSLDSEGHVLVADWNNDRTLLLNSQLQLQRVLVDRESQDEFRLPVRLHYNELTSQLYVIHGGTVWPAVVSLFNLR